MNAVAGLVADLAVMHLKKPRAKHQHANKFFSPHLRIFFQSHPHGERCHRLPMWQTEKGNLIFGLRLQTQITNGVLICTCDIGSIVTKRCCNIGFKCNHALIMRSLKPINDIINAVNTIIKVLTPRMHLVYFGNQTINISRVMRGNTTLHFLHPRI